MFGMGLGEILLVAIIAIVFLGPDKLPDALVKTAKFFKKIKITVNDAKSTLEEEIGVDEVKQEAEKYKKSIENTTHEITKSKENSSREVKDLFDDLKKDS
jgi:sec-independent protein translocase protein TatB